LEGIRIFGGFLKKRDDRYCPKCGREIPFDVKVCPYCGKKFKEL
jgi:predicted amidophosphoribosyltransferase